MPIDALARQPDFVILSPRWGAPRLEVKNWKRSTPAGATRDSVEFDTPRRRIAEANSLRPTRNFTLELVDVILVPEALLRSYQIGAPATATGRVPGRRSVREPNDVHEELRCAPVPNRFRRREPICRQQSRAAHHRSLR